MRRSIEAVLSVLIVWTVLFLFMMLLDGPAYGATSPACAQIPNLACASGTPTTETVNTQWLFSGANVGANPFVFDGVTADTNKTTVAVTDPTGARTFTIPNADSAAGQAISCSAGQHVNTFSAATGAFTCSADTAPAHNLLSTTHSDTLAASPTRGDVIVANSTPAWARLAVGTANKVLHSDGTDATWQTLTASDIGAGTLSGVLVWNESCTASPCTLANTPRTADTALVIWRTLTLRRVAACGGANEYTISGVTLTLCDSTGVGAAPNNVLVAYER